MLITTRNKKWIFL